MTDEPLPTVFKTTAQDPVGRANPHPRLDRLRNECPVMFDVQMGAFFLTRHADVHAILSDRSMLRDPDKALPEARTIKLLRRPPSANSLDHGRPLSSILFLDNPDHARIREPFLRAFHAQIEASRQRVTEIIERTVADLAKHTEFDAVRDFAHAIPIQVMAMLIGIPQARIDEFQTWSEDASLALHPMRSAANTQRMEAGQNALHEFLLNLLHQRRRTPEDDLTSRLARLQQDGVEISDHELQANLRLLLIAGNLTTSDLIGSLIWLLLSNPGELDKLRGDWSLIARAVEEALRMESPIDAADRVAPDTLKIGGCAIEKGQAMTLSLRGANRDPSVFRNPHVFEIDRPRVAHIAFGGGAHFCLGAPLARLEAQIAVATLLKQFPGLRLEHPHAAPKWRALPPFRGLTSLPVLAG